MKALVRDMQTRFQLDWMEDVEIFDVKPHVQVAHVQFHLPSLS